MKKVNVQLNTIEDVKNFCNAAMNSNTKVDVISGRYVIDGASLMGLLSLDLAHPIEVHYEDEAFKEAISANIIEE